MALRPDLVGSQSEPVSFAWARDDVLLYALAVGAGQEDPTAELALTTENTDGVRTAVLPTYANIITRGARPDLGDFDRARLVHAEQSFTVHRPLPAEGRARVTATVTDVLPATAWERAFEIARSGSGGKVVLDWTVFDGS